MPAWLIAFAASITLVALGLLWRRQVRVRGELLARLTQLEERATAADAETQRCADNVTILQRLLLEKGVADEEDFEAAKRADELDALSNQRGVH